MVRISPLMSFTCLQPGRSLCMGGRASLTPHGNQAGRLCCCRDHTGSHPLFALHCGRAPHKHSLCDPTAHSLPDKLPWGGVGVQRSSPSPLPPTHSHTHSFTHSSSAWLKTIKTPVTVTTRKTFPFWNNTFFNLCQSLESIPAYNEV